MINAIILIVSSLISFQLFASETITGKAMDPTNFSCLDSKKLVKQKEAALAHLQERIRLKVGICAWHSGDYVVETAPKVFCQDLGPQGCQILASVLGSCR